MVMIMVIEVSTFITEFRLLDMTELYASMNNANNKRAVDAPMVSSNGHENVTAFFIFRPAVETATSPMFPLLRQK